MNHGLDENNGQLFLYADQFHPPFALFHTSR
jgi:hypothetical protein